jgi:hypothetical protein
MSGRIAQVVERPPLDREVRGSNPSHDTMTLLLGRHYEFPQCGIIKGKLLLLLLTDLYYLTWRNYQSLERLLWSRRGSNPVPLSLRVLCLTNSILCPLHPSLHTPMCMSTTYLFSARTGFLHPSEHLYMLSPSSVSFTVISFSEAWVK